MLKPDISTKYHIQKYIKNKKAVFLITYLLPNCVFCHWYSFQCNIFCLTGLFKIIQILEYNEQSKWTLGSLIQPMTFIFLQTVKGCPFYTCLDNFTIFAGATNHLNVNSWFHSDCEYDFLSVSPDYKVSQSWKTLNCCRVLCKAHSAQMSKKLYMLP